LILSVLLSYKCHVINIDMNKPKIIVIIGPTASGKTDLSIKLANKFDGEIIAADSKTIYREMNIGTAKPEKDNNYDSQKYIVEGILHWGIDIINPNENFSVADFKNYADSKIEEIIQRGKTPIIVGGTGLYIQAIVDNLSFTKVEANYKLRDELEKLSIEDLVKRLGKIDKEALEVLDLMNKRRVIRAVEIVEVSGKKFKSQQNRGESRYEVLIFGIHTQREILYKRIEMRVDNMIEEELVDEVRRLKDKYGCKINAMTGIGYRQICAFLEGKMTLEDAIELLKRDTRRYAKRQITWFKRDNRINWIDFKDDITAKVAEFLK